MRLHGVAYVFWGPNERALGSWDPAEAGYLRPVYVLFFSASSLSFARALADPTRQQIMELCCCRWMSVGEIVEAVHVGQSTVSHHLAVLREAGLVDMRQEGKHTFYTLDQQRVVTCCGQIMEVFAPEVTGPAESPSSGDRDL